MSWVLVIKARKVGWLQVRWRSPLVSPQWPCVLASHNEGRDAIRYGYGGGGVDDPALTVLGVSRVDYLGLRPPWVAGCTPGCNRAGLWP